MRHSKRWCRLVAIGAIQAGNTKLVVQYEIDLFVNDVYIPEANQ